MSKDREDHHPQLTVGLSHSTSWVRWLGVDPPPSSLNGCVWRPCVSPAGALPAPLPVLSPPRSPFIPRFFSPVLSPPLSPFPLSSYPLPPHSPLPAPSPSSPPSAPLPRPPPPPSRVGVAVGLRLPREQLRSSRSTRNQDHTPRNRGGVPDFDPTEGLPVRRWERQTVRVNQDVSADASESNAQANDKDSDFPWPEQPLPSFFSQLAPHNQELLRRARMGNVNAKLSVWDPKTNSYIPGIELERREAARKMALNKPKHTSIINPDETHPLEDDDDKPDDDADDLLDAEGLPEKRRKTASGSAERVIEVKKWVQVPLAVAEKMPEPKYLADRRPGMESLYKGAYKATNGFGTLGDMGAAATSGATTGYDLGDPTSALAGGSGSGPLNGGADGANVDGTATPARKNIPPRRKKKGGPGRRPKNWKPPTDPNAPPSNENTTADTAGDGRDTVVDDMPAATGEPIDPTGEGPAVQREANSQDGEGEGEGDGEGDGDGDGDGSGSESEGEGSEEGEIAPANAPVQENLAGNVVPAPAPVVETVVETAAAVVVEPEHAPEKEEEEEEEEKQGAEDVVVADVETHEVATEKDAEKTEDVATGLEVDVLGALEAAVDKEAGQSAE
ncbi:hypothetical protein CLCR_08211 [Cladophialophora carrionii]|uniref:Uncharacterized protein n=1 Tax=Cladophialophora carrionii TaxID=86049 RepID=A0A1C1CT18_9EURO|nr:hypothetical protein CLCR_08211 [Cladophialophora carrionii]